MSLRSSTNILPFPDSSFSRFHDRAVRDPSNLRLTKHRSPSGDLKSGNLSKYKRQSKREMEWKEARTTLYAGWKVGVSESEGDATERPQTGSLQTRQSRARNCYQLCGGGEEYGTVSGRASSPLPLPSLK